VLQKIIENEKLLERCQSQLSVRHESSETHSNIQASLSLDGYSSIHARCSHKDQGRYVRSRKSVQDSAKGKQ
jgi:hypothetical protein